MNDFAFTGGRPDPDTFPTEKLIEASAKALQNLGGNLVSYPGDNGYQGLREVCSLRFERREGVPLPIDQISITSGSMQSLDLILRNLLEPGDIVLTEELVYSGTLGLLRHLKTNIVGVPLDYVEGLDPDALEEILIDFQGKNIKPKLIYVTPNHQNPTGAILTLERRKRLIELAETFDLFIVEDDCYGDIDFTPEPIPNSLFTLDQSNRVIYVATFSKILGAGVRLGYFVARAPYDKIISNDRWDLGTSALSSAIVAEFFRDNLDQHLEITNAVVGAKCRAVTKTLEEHVSDICTWTKPRGGLFLWVDLPEQTDMQKMQTLAAEKGVHFSTGNAFHATGKPIKAIRIAYAYCPLDYVADGIRHLCHAIRAAQN